MAFLAALAPMLAAAGGTAAVAGSAYSIYANKRALDKARKTPTGTYVSSNLTPEESRFQTLQLELARLQGAIGEVSQAQEAEAAAGSEIPLPAIGLGVVAVLAFFLLRKK